MCEEKMKINIEAKKKIITPFLDDDGKITRVPAPNKTKIPVLEYLAGKFEQQQILNEKEVNEIINNWHTFGDHYILRRLLIDYKFLDRTPNGAKYWLVEKELNSLNTKVL